jgi:hypothetical protein
MSTCTRPRAASHLTRMDGHADRRRQAVQRHVDGRRDPPAAAALVAVSKPSHSLRP